MTKLTLQGETFDHHNGKRIQSTPRSHLVTIKWTRRSECGITALRDIPSPSPLLYLPFLIGVQYCTDGVGLTCTMTPGGGCCLDSKRRGCAMFGRPSSAVLMCANRAAECKMQAALADSPDTERYYLGLAKGWLVHGKDHAFTETVDSILSRHRNEPEMESP